IFLENLFAKTYDATHLEDDMELVREALQNRGFFKGNVGDPQTKIRDTGHSGFTFFLFGRALGRQWMSRFLSTKVIVISWGESHSRATRRLLTQRPCDHFSRSRTAIFSIGKKSPRAW